MTTNALLKKIATIEKKLKDLKQPKPVLGKLEVDEAVLEEAAKALGDFDIERYVTKKDLAVRCGTHH